MKKLNILKALALALGVSAFFSCKSTPDLNPVDAFELLDGEGVMYLTVPVKSNSEFVSSAIQKIAKTEEKDAEKITERLDIAYIEISADSEIKLSASGKIPTNFVGMALNEKNGWKVNVIDNQTVYTHQQTLYQLCMPSSSNAFISHYIEPMVQKFNEIAYSQQNFENINIQSSAVTEKAYQFLHEKISSDIMIYAPVPKAFIKAFIGADVKAPVDSIYAVLTPLSNGKEFGLKIIIGLSDSRTVKAACAALKLALFPIPAKIVQTASQQITITDITLSKKEVLSLIR
ncbi:lipoprotein [Treponema sp.]|uniref:lipoprotein n=1 Tax=Treponema sp. TaxID=166 RepID=UPI003890B0B2